MARDRRLTHMSALDAPGVKNAARLNVQASTSRMTGQGAIVTGTLLSIEGEPTWRAEVDVHGGVVVLGATPGAYVVGGGVFVQVDAHGRPTWVTGPTDQPVPDANGPSTVGQGATPVLFQPSFIVDEAARQRAEEARETLTHAFTTLDRPPTVADGEGKPEGAWWTETNAAGEQVARWEWVEGAWVERPIAPEFIPEAYIDFLAANEAFIANLSGEIITADLFQGKEFVGGTFTGMTFLGGQIVIQTAGGSPIFTASPAGGVSIGGEGILWQQAGGVVADASSATSGAISADVAVFPGGVYRAQITITKVDGGENVAYTVDAEWRNSSGSLIGYTPAVLQHVPTTTGDTHDVVLTPVAGATSVRLRWSRSGTWPGYESVTFTNGRISAVGTGNVSVSGDVKGRRGNFDELDVGGVIKGLSRYGANGNERLTTWTTSKTNAGRGTLQGAGTIALDTSRTVGRPSATEVQLESLWIMEAGIYTVTRNVQFSERPMEGRAYAEIAGEGQRWRVNMFNEDRGVATTGAYYFAAGSRIDFPTFYSGTGAYNTSGHITILRHE